MGYVMDHLNPGERVIAWGRYNFLFQIRDLILVAVAAALAAWVWLILPDQIATLSSEALRRPETLALLRWASLGLLVVMVLVWLAGAIKRWSTEIAVTNRRLIFKRGLIARRAIEISLSQVETIRTEQSILGRIFGYGQVIIQGTGMGDVVLPHQLASPFRFRQKIGEARASFLTGAAGGPSA